MTSKEIYELLQSEKGIKDLYKKYEKCFEIIDNWSDIYISGDLLDENQLAYSLDQSTGIFAKLCPVVNALESYMERILNNEETAYYSKQEKVRTQDTSQAKALARSKVSDIRDYLSDFKSYLLASQQNIVSAQSRLKRLVAEGSAKGIAHYGEVPVNDEDLSHSSEKAWDS